MRLPDLAYLADPSLLALDLDLELDEWQRDVLRAHSDRALLNVCRQGGKSTVMALLSVHTALFEPGSLTLMVAPTMRQSAELLAAADRMYRRLGRPVALLTESVLSL